MNVFHDKQTSIWCRHSSIFVIATTYRVSSFNVTAFSGALSARSSFPIAICEPSSSSAPAVRSRHRSSHNPEASLTDRDLRLRRRRRDSSIVANKTVIRSWRLLLESRSSCLYLHSLHRFACLLSKWLYCVNVTFGYQSFESISLFSCCIRSLVHQSWADMSPPFLDPFVLNSIPSFFHDSTKIFNCTHFL